MKSRICTWLWKPPAASKRWSLLLGVLTAALCGWSTTASADTERTPLRVGAAAAELAVPEGTFLAGYGRNRRATGQHDALWARSVFFTDSTTSLAIVSVDNIGLTRPDIHRIQQRSARLLAKQGYATAPAHIIVSSTHTHAGPDVVGLWGRHLFSSGRDPQLLEQWIEAIAQQVQRAAERAQPAFLQAASALAPRDWVENRSEPGSLDTTLSSMAITNAQSGDTIATLTNYACHPTVLGPDNTLSSADWVAGFYQTMTASMPGVHLFLQGAIGGWVQPIQDARTIEEARGYGQDLAQATLALLAEAPNEQDASLAIATATAQFELDNFGFELLMLLGVMDRPTTNDTVPADIAWLRVGRSQLITHPGETAPSYGLASRALLNSKDPTFVLGLTQDALGYILRPEFFDDDAPYPDAEYLTSVSLGVNTGPTLMQALRALMRKRPARLAPPITDATGALR